MASIIHRKCGASTSALTFFLAVLLLTALPGVSAGVKPVFVTTATCAVNADGACLDGTLTFTGVDLADVTAVRIGLTTADEALLTCGGVTASATTVTCTLAVNAAASAGLYPASLVLSSGVTVEAGSFLIGNFYEMTSLPRWTSTKNSSTYRVTGQSGDWPSTGDTWSVTGTFDTASTYSIVFYNNQPKAASGSPGTPTCTPVAVTATALTCTIASTTGVMGMYNFLVKDSTNSALLLGSTALGMLAVNPPLPEVTGASGTCATSSAACVSGAALTIAGTNFNYRSAAYQKFYVGVTSAQRSAIQLTPTAVDKSSVTVVISLNGKVAAGSYPVFVRVQVCMMGMMAPLRYVGNLVLGASDASVAGFNTEMLNGETAEDNGANFLKMSAGYIAAIACACVFGVLFLIAVAALVVFCLRQRKRHQRWSMREAHLASQQYNNASGDFAMPKVGGPATPYGDY